MNQDINRDKWFLCRNSCPLASMRLFCFPFGGGGASIFRDWPDAMGDDIEVRALQLPGREARFREPVETDFNKLIKDVVLALDGYQDKPYALFGYSYGALLAFEVTRELRRQNRNLPVHLFVGAVGAPQIESSHPPIAELDDVAFVERVEDYYQPDGEAWNNIELRELMLPVLKADIAVCESYVYQDDAPLPCPIDVFVSDEDRATPLEDTRYWDEQTTGKVGHHIFKGGHFFIDDAEAEIHGLVLRAITGNK